MRPWHTYSDYLKERYGEPVYRVAIDAGFTCPNRAGGMGGCSFCDATGSIASYQRASESSFKSDSPFSPEVSSGEYRRNMSIEEQAERAVEFLRRRYKANLFSVHLQAFTNTYADSEYLRKIYQRCLKAVPGAVSLIVSTRPDALEDDKLAVLSSFITEERDVWLEIGLQTANDETLLRIGRGHDSHSWSDAVERSRANGMKVSCHVILSLPGEGRDDVIRTASLVADSGIQAVKIHNLHIPGGTRMGEEYLDGCITAPSFERHLEVSELFLRNIPYSIVVERLTADTPRHRLMAPRNFPDKSSFLSSLEKRMRNNGTMQGDSYER